MHVICQRNENFHTPMDFKRSNAKWHFGHTREASENETGNSSKSAEPPIVQWPCRHSTEQLSIDDDIWLLVHIIFFIKHQKEWGHGYHANSCPKNQVQVKVCYRSIRTIPLCGDSLRFGESPRTNIARKCKPVKVYGVAEVFMARPRPHFLPDAFWWIWTSRYQPTLTAPIVTAQYYSKRSHLDADQLNGAHSHLTSPQFKRKLVFFAPIFPHEYDTTLFLLLPWWILCY